MYWDDEAYLLSKINYNENSVIVEVFTQNHGKCSGIIYGGTSRNIYKSAIKFQYQANLKREEKLIISQLNQF